MVDLEPMLTERPRVEPSRAADVPVVKVLIVVFYFPPAGGGGVQRPLKLLQHLPEHGVEVHVLAPDDPKWIARDEGPLIPPWARLHRAPYLGPRGRRPAEELHGLRGIRRVVKGVRLLGRRLWIPDEHVAWAGTAIPAARRIVKREGIEVLITTSPPGSIHLVGAAVRRLTGVAWIADLRDPLVGHPHRRIERRSVRAKEWIARRLEHLVVSRADRLVAVSDAIASDLRARYGGVPVTVVPNGADFEDFGELQYRRGEQFRITHAGSFFGERTPRPFLSALAAVEGVQARFVGDSRGADRSWASEQGLGSVVEWIPFAPRERALELQRDSEALLLLIPEAAGRGDGILSGKVFEYLAAGRPILALVPPGGEAARLIRATGAGIVVEPNDVAAAAEALVALRDRWRAGADLEVELDPGQREHLSRQSGIAAYAELIRAVGQASPLVRRRRPGLQNRGDRPAPRPGEVRDPEQAPVESVSS